MYKKLFLLLSALLILDIVYSAFQHYHGVLDGDMASIILPAERYHQVLEDPFAFSALLQHATYGGVNRYFAHALMSLFFKTVPFIFQLVVNPLASVYLSCSVAKTGTQVFLIYLMAAYISGSWRIANRKFILAAVLVTPFFQTTGFNGDMSIIDASPTYVFFYALGFAWVLLFFLPFFMRWFHQHEQPLSNIRLVLLFLFSVFIVFNGPLNVPVLVLVCAALWIRQCWYYIERRLPMLSSRRPLVKKPIAAKYMALFAFTILVALYSLYIGRYNSENFWNDTVSLGERYRRLPTGLHDFFISVDVGPYLLLIMVGLNVIVLYLQTANEKSRKLIRLFYWIIIFSIVYLALLPLGGYRPYRPTIIKKDLGLPVLLLLIIFYGISTSYLLQQIRLAPQKAYAMLVLIPLLIYTYKDKPGRGRDYCQKASIRQIRDTPGPLVQISSDCHVLTWEKVTDYHDSKISMDMLRYWRVIKEEKYFYQQ